MLLFTLFFWTHTHKLCDYFLQVLHKQSGAGRRLIPTCTEVAGKAVGVHAMLASCVGGRGVE